MKNPHFDEGLVIWKDEYTGCYAPPPTGYSEQFDLQWKLALEDQSYYNHPGASVEDKDIDDRIYEWTGQHPTGKEYYDAWSHSSLILPQPVDVSLIRSKACIDIGCGLGRWTKVMLALGANSVLSVDMSESALHSVRRFNSDTRKVNIMNIPSEHPDLIEKFDFANFWGVAMCTHDPQRAFMSAASTVRPGGALYLMVYAPEGMHGTKLVNIQRKHFAKLNSLEQRLAYVEHVYHRKWDGEYPVFSNVKNLLRNVMGRSKGGRIGVLDMLEPFYNWVIPVDVIYQWMDKAGFQDVKWLNEHDFRSTRAKAAAYHVLGRNKKSGEPAERPG